MSVAESLMMFDSIRSSGYCVRKFNSVEAEEAKNLSAVDERK